MDLQELARHERQRLAVDALERQVAHRGREHVAVDEAELEVFGHERFPETECVVRQGRRRSIARYNKG